MPVLLGRGGEPGPERTQGGTATGQEGRSLGLPGNGAGTDGHAHTLRRLDTHRDTHRHTLALTRKHRSTWTRALAPCDRYTPAGTHVRAHTGARHPGRPGVHWAGRAPASLRLDDSCSTVPVSRLQPGSLPAAGQTDAHVTARKGPRPPPVAQARGMMKQSCPSGEDMGLGLTLPGVFS